MPGGGSGSVGKCVDWCARVVTQCLYQTTVGAQHESRTGSWRPLSEGQDMMAAMEAFVHTTPLLGLDLRPPAIDVQRQGQGDCNRVSQYQ